MGQGFGISTLVLRHVKAGSVEQTRRSHHGDVRSLVPFAEVDSIPEPNTQPNTLIMVYSVWHFSAVTVGGWSFCERGRFLLVRKDNRLTYVPSYSCGLECPKMHAKWGEWN